MRRASGSVRAIGWVISCFLFTACLPLTIPVSVPARSGVDPMQPGDFIAGAHREDITPVPGIALGGYSIDGKASRGFWSRLHARALYLKDAQGKPLVLISTDLGAIPGGLGDEVTRRLHADYGMTWISREHVVLAGTHTHHGPGNFYTSELFNSMISPWTGFDQQLFDFLAKRIAFAVKKARDDAKTAELYVTDATTLEMSKAWNLDKYFRNRSFPAFLLNPRAPELLDTSLNPDCPLWPDDPDTPDQPDPRACQAVRPRVELLGIRQTGFSTYLGVAAFVPVHATVLPPSLEVYSSDLFGVADALLENASTCSELGADPVVAFFNGAEGDVSPTSTTRSHDEVVDLGGRLATKVCDLLSQMRKVDTTLHFRFARVALASQPFADGTRFLDQSGALASEQRTTTSAGVAGAASVGGAEDGRSVLYKLLGHREGKTMIARGKDGPKSPAGQVEAMGIDMNMTWLMRWTSPPPDLAPVGVYSIGSASPNVIIVALPGEFTTQMGERVRQAVWSAIVPPKPRPSKPEHLLLIGLANEYVGYFTTPEEYDAQHYEGAMTLYGPASGPYVANVLAGLAGAGGDVPVQPADWSHTYLPGSKRDGFQAKEVALGPYAQDDGLAPLLSRGGLANAEVRRDLPIFCWRDALPRLQGGGDACSRSNPEVWVETKKTTDMAWHRVDAAGGLEIVTYVTGVGMDAQANYRTDWCAVWLGAPDHLEPSHANDFVFRVNPLRDVTNPPAPVSSKPFDLVDSGTSGWADKRFLQHPTPPLTATFPVFWFPQLVQVAGQCTVPDPS